jgi:hypothetical protein
MKNTTYRTAKQIGKETFRSIIDRYKQKDINTLASEIEMETRMAKRQPLASAQDYWDQVQVMEWALEEKKLELSK